MKNVVLALKSGMTMKHFLPITELLIDSGIGVWAYLADEELPHKPDALYITDCKTTASELMAKNLPLLGFSHGEGDAMSGMEYVMEQPEEIELLYLERVYRRFRDIPWDILETERCIIRESTVEDVEVFFTIYEDEDIVKYTDALYPDVEQEKAYMRQYIDKIYRYFEFGIWTVLLKESGEVIGRAGFAVRDGYELPDFGFVIGKSWQQKGIAYEICKALLELGKTYYEFEQVQALVMPENIPSCRLCHKLGFAENGMVTEKGKEYLYLLKVI